MLAGGTDVVVQMLQGALRPRSLVHIRRLSELRGIVSADRTQDRRAGHALGASTGRGRAIRPPVARRGCGDRRRTADAERRHDRRERRQCVAGRRPAAGAARRERGGSDPELVRRERSLPLEDFLLDRKRTALRPDELVTAISLERPGPRTGETYLKIGRRGAMEVALVGLAVRLRLDDDTLADVRIAACSVGPRAFRVREAEAALVGTSGDGPAIAEAARQLQAEARPDRRCPRNGGLPAEGTGGAAASRLSRESLEAARKTEEGG